VRSLCVCRLTVNITVCWGPYCCLPHLTAWPSVGRMDVSRFTIMEDLQWFTKTMMRVVQEEISEELAKMTEPFHYFVEFLR